MNPETRKQEGVRLAAETELIREWDCTSNDLYQIALTGKIRLMNLQSELLSLTTALEKTREEMQEWIDENDTGTPLSKIQCGVMKHALSLLPEQTKEGKPHV